MSGFSIARTEYAGYDARRLAAAEARLVAVFLPGLGMLGASFSHRGEELLGLADQVERYATRGSTMGIPLLHPWANRLDGFRYSAGGREVELDPGSPLLHLDGNGLPIHGIVGVALPWEVVDEGADDRDAWLAARLELVRPELSAVFPFPHRLDVEVRLGAELSLRTTLTATGDAAVPVSFGYHPYLRLPGVPRPEWRVELPVTARALSDERQIPTGEEEPLEPFAGPLDGRVFDDGYPGLADPPAFVLEGGGRRVVLEFRDGYPYAQIFAPAERDVVCFEPMTAPTNALASGRGLRFVEPGESFTAAFAIRVEEF